MRNSTVLNTAMVLGLAIASIQACKTSNRDLEGRVAQLEALVMQLLPKLRKTSPGSIAPRRTRVCHMLQFLLPTLLILHASVAVPDDPEGCGIDYAAIQAEEIEIIDQGIRIYAEVHPDERSAEQAAQVEAAFDLLDDRERPVDDDDVAILERALEIFSSEQNWNREDDRECGQDGEMVSIFCALQSASVDVTGEYLHRRTALQEVRFVIAERSEGRDYQHRMQDYNNDPRTSFADARSTMEIALEIVRERLEQQVRCEFVP